MAEDHPSTGHDISATTANSRAGDGPVVEFDDVTISFDVKPVLQGISFSVERGQTLILLGPAGCGKSVLLKLANGLLKPDSGTIRVFGEDIDKLPRREMYALRARIGMVFQESALFDSLNVEDNVAYRLHEEQVPEAEAHERVVEALKFVELETAIDKFPSELSGGMRRRVSIARAIISNPDLILYDSPTGGLDPITSTTIIELVMKQRDVSHTTSLLVTHRLQDAFMLATHRFDAANGGMTTIHKDADGHNVDKGTRFLMLNEGKIVFDGNTEELIHSDDPWIKRYLE
jgi:phospholipid/cholesterol/gamma-HCH transport system ATP-binding protein